MLTGLVGGHFGKVVVKNLLKQFTSSDNLLSGTWSITGTGNSVDQTAEDALIIADNGTLRGDLDFDYPKGEVFTVSVDIENVDVVATISLGVVDNFLIGSIVNIAPDATYKRYSVTIDTSGMLGTTVGKVQIGIADYVSGSTLKVKRVFVERVTGKTNQNPSSYVPNSSSKQLNGFMHQADSSIPSTTVAEGCPLADGTQDINTTNSGWCWGANTTWDITGNLLNSGAAFNSIHSKQFSSANRYYDYQYTIGVVKLLVLPQICGVVVAAGQDAIGTHSGRVVATGVEQLFVGNSGIASGGTISDVSIIECDADSNVDGVAFRHAAGNLSVDPVTKVVTE